MSRYLVVAHQTATSEALLDKLREIDRGDPGVAFTLIVPATPVQHLLTFREGESVAVAAQSAASAKERMEQAGLQVEDATIGDPSPILAIGDAIRDSGPFEAVVISTLPLGISRWLKLDIHARARHQFDLPVISVVAGKAESKTGVR